MIPAILVILISGSPIASIEGFVSPQTCNKVLPLPKIEDKDHHPVTARVDCGKP